MSNRSLAALFVKRSAVGQNVPIPIPNRKTYIPQQDTGNWRCRFAPEILERPRIVAAPPVLGGCNLVVMNPSGYIANQQPT